MKCDHCDCYRDPEHGCGTIGCNGNESNHATKRLAALEYRIARLERLAVLTEQTNRKAVC